MRDELYLSTMSEPYTQLQINTHHPPRSLTLMSQDILIFLPGRSGDLNLTMGTLAWVIGSMSCMLQFANTLAKACTLYSAGSEEIFFGAEWNRPGGGVLDPGGTRHRDG